MHKYIYVFLFGVIAIVAVTSCKTTEANYRTAYEKAVNRGMDTDEADVESIETAFVVSGGDTIPVAVRMLSPVDDGSAGNGRPVSNVGSAVSGGSMSDAAMKAYGVAVARFRQQFNALSMRDALRDAGYSGAVVVKAPDSYCYVVAVSFDTAAEAYRKLADIKSTSSLPLVEAGSAVSVRPPMPVILHDPRSK